MRGGEADGDGEEAGLGLGRGRGPQEGRMRLNNTSSVANKKPSEMPGPPKWTMWQIFLVL